MQVTKLRKRLSLSPLIANFLNEDSPVTINDSLRTKILNSLTAFVVDTGRREPLIEVEFVGGGEGYIDVQPKSALQHFNNVFTPNENILSLMYLLEESELAEFCSILTNILIEEVVSA